MMRGLVLGGVVLAVCPSCKTGGENADPEETKTGTDTTRGSAGGFSAGLSADLAKGGSGSAVASAGATGSADAAMTAGSGSGSAAGSGSAGGSATGSGSTAAVAADSGSSKSSGSGSGSGSASNVAAGSAKPAAGSGSAVAVAVKDTKPAAGSGSAVAVVAPPKPAVELTPELKAIKLSLQPNWVRDVAAPGTISLDVNVQSRDLHTTFRFDYGYESDKAPVDREQYKKYLADTKQMTVTTDRQRGAAWYLEGPDGNGKFSFKLVVLYGGKRLICGGSSYKESDLGDIRDQVVIQAKSICETIAL